MQHQGENPQFISYMLLKKDWIDVLPQALWLTRCHNRNRYGLLNMRFSTLKCFLWDTASVLPVYGSCSELRASSKAVYFLPFCINSELLFLLPQHSHATTPNTVVFAENHSCAKSVTMFTFLRKDMLPQMKPHPHYWRTNHLRHPKHHRSQHRHPWGTH